MLEDPEVRANTKEFKFEPPAAPEEVEDCERRLGRSLPADLRAFYRESRGGSGWVGEAFVDLYPPSEIADAEEAQPFVQEGWPGALVFGSDGGGEFLAYTPEGGATSGIVVVPMIGFCREDAVRVASNLRELLLRTKPLLSV